MNILRDNSAIALEEAVYLVKTRRVRKGGLKISILWFRFRLVSNNREYLEAKAEM